MYGTIRLLSIIICFNLISLIAASAQEDQQQTSKITLTSTIMDAEGLPIAGALIYGDGGSVRVQSSSDGSFTIQVSPNSFLLVEKEGYSTQRITMLQGTIPDVITLEVLAYELTESDEVNLPFTTLLKRDLPGMVTTLDAEEILRYDGEQDFNKVLNGRVPGLFRNMDVYGLGEAQLVVDGIPRPGRINIGGGGRPERILNLQEISQITVLKDISSRLLYGTQAELPVILVTTKQGQPYKRQMKVRLETGLMNPISYPEFMGAADYMELYNEALQNDDKLPKYDQQSIDNTRSGTDPVLYPDEDYYNSSFLRNNKSFYHLTTQASGGNDAATYYAFLGWNRQHSLLTEGRKEFDDFINIRGNVNYNITDHIKMKFNGLALFDIHKGPNGNFWGNSSTFIPNRNPLLIPVTEADQVPSTSIMNGNKVLGGTSEFTTNIYGDLVRAGYRNAYSRYLQVNTGFDFDLSPLLEGLSASVNLAFDLFNYYEARQLNQYAVYQPMMGGSGGDSLYLVQHGVDVKQGQENINNAHFFRKIGFYGTLNYNRVIQENHEIRAVGVVFGDQFKRNESYTEFKRDLHFGLQGNYNFKHKYSVQLGAVVAGSPAYSSENRWAFSPAAAAGWVLSEEDFFPSTMFFKLKASLGRIHTDREHHSSYLFRNNFTRGSNFYYQDGNGINQIANIQTVGNPDLGWARRDHFSVGFDAALLDYSLKIEAAYFYSRLSDVATLDTNSRPAFMGVLPYRNYNSFQDQGFELGINYTTSFNDLTLTVGGNFTYAIPKVVQMDELNYPDDYRRQTGKPTDAIFGLVSEGFYTENDFTDGQLNGNLPVPSFGAVQPGDLQYQDLNNDGRIDINDEKVIGYSHARMQYGLNLRLEFKFLELFVLGTGQTGESTIYNTPYYWVFGERKYPQYITGRWTPGTASAATYPRLSSTENAHNFRNSTFWLYENNWFTLHTVQLSANLPYSLAERAFFKELQVYLRANNLLTVSQNRERRELNIGTEPQFRVFAFGINASF
jgi:TonB-linked SusC/RagA family outer membrane protein